MYLETFMQECIDIKKEVDAFGMEIIYLSDEHWECYFSLRGSLNLYCVRCLPLHQFRVQISKGGTLTLVYERSDIKPKEKNLKENKKI